jgi:tetratricopeptide (TPR) repeat protein
VPAAGECEVDVEVAATDHETARKTVKLLLRRHPLWGIVLVAVGLVISSVLRWVTVVRSPSLELRARLVRARQDLDRAMRSFAPCSPEEREVEGEVARAIGRAFEELAPSWLRRKKPEEDRVVALEKKVRLLPDWIEADRRRGSVSLTGEVQIRLERVFSDTVSVLRREGSAAAEVDGAAEALGKVLSDIDKELGQQIAAPIRALRAQLDKADASVSAAVNDARKALDRAEKACAKERFSLARTEYDHARGTFGRALAAALLEKLPERRPRGIEAEPWSALRRTLVEMLEAAKIAEDALALDQYERASTLFLERRVHGFHDWLGRKGDGMPPAIKSGIGPVHDAINAADAALKAGNPEGAEAEYERALQNYATLERDAGVHLGPPGKPGKEALPPTAPDAGTGLLASDPGALVDPRAGRSVRPLPSPTTLEGEMLRTEILLGLAVFAIAVVVGFHSLHIGGPTWGTPEDLLMAALWGLGLHQAAGAAFIGLPGLRKLFAAAGAE